jgi:hypothetical protein
MIRDGDVAPDKTPEGWRSAMYGSQLRDGEPPQQSGGPCSTKPGPKRSGLKLGGADGLFLWLLFRHPRSIAALGLGLRILRPLLRLVAAFLHVGLRVVDHLVSPPTVEIRKSVSSSTITSVRPATQTFDRLTGDLRDGGKAGPRNPSRPRRKRCRAEQAAVARMFNSQSAIRLSASGAVRANAVWEPHRSVAVEGRLGILPNSVRGLSPTIASPRLAMLKRCQLPSPSDASIATRTPDLAPAR